MGNGPRLKRTDAELASVRRLATAENLSGNESVRRAPRSEVAKLAWIREAAGFSFPTGNVEDFQREIAAGYVQSTL
jgi:hypothetical protein